MTEIRVSLRPGVSIADAGNGIWLQTPAGRVTMPASLSPIAEALADGGRTENALYALARSTDGARGTTRLRIALVQYARLLRHTLVVDEEPLVAQETIGGGCFSIGSIAALQPELQYRLSRFAVCRLEGEELAIESPLSRWRLVLCAARAASILAALTTSRTPAEISVCCPGLSSTESTALLEWLVAAQLAAVADGQDGVDIDRAASSWPLDDLLFHARSRMGLHAAESGGTYRFRDTIPPLPARKPAMSTTTINLRRPEPGTGAGSNRPFLDVLEQRRRAVGRNQPIGVGQLGELLYRSARVRSSTAVDVSARSFHEITSRPYPSGGSIYELELYVIARTCGGLLAGLYHYDPFAHTLERLSGPCAHSNALLAEAAAAACLPDLPSLSIALAARFQRRAWKYVGIAYANALKGVGVLQETMILVAADMKLAARAVDARSERSFAAATGLEPEVEGLVGTLVLGGGWERPA